MGGRIAERISLKVKITFCCDNKFHAGTVTNLSEKGMFIQMKKTCCNLDPLFGVSFPLEHNQVNIHVKPVRIIRIDRCFEGVGVELINPPEAYLKFIYDLMAVL